MLIYASKFLDKRKSKSSPIKPPKPDRPTTWCHCTRLFDPIHNQGLGYLNGSFKEPSCAYSEKKEVPLICDYRDAVSWLALQCPTTQPHSKPHGLGREVRNTTWDPENIRRPNIRTLLPLSPKELVLSKTGGGNCSASTLGQYLAPGSA